jgi:iron complex outermembrane receptor protein
MKAKINQPIRRLPILSFLFFTAVQAYCQTGTVQGTVKGTIPVTAPVTTPVTAPGTVPGAVRGIAGGTIRGIVRGSDGFPLAGASVVVEGSGTGATTDDAGQFLLSIAAGQYTISASYIGQGTAGFPVTVESGKTVEQDITIRAVTSLDEAVVVGSRSRDARSRLSTAVPVDVVRTKDIKPFAQMDLAQMLTYTVPSFQSARQTISDGTDHIDPAGLRGLGPDQTLVLLNGKRMHSTALVNINGTIGRGSVGTDLNTIPVAAIERIEVLRDGASAQYGSDAIAGVINIILKKNYRGFTVSGTAGENFTRLPYNGGVNIQDGANAQLDFTGGIANANGSYFNVSGQWLRREATNRSGDDNFPLVYLGNAGAFPTNPYTSSGVSDVQYRQWLMDQDAAMAKQRGYSRHNVTEGNSFSQAFSVYLNAGSRLTDGLDWYITAGGTRREGLATGQSRNPNSVSQQPVRSDGSRYYPDGFLPQIAPTIYDFNFLTGLRIKAGNWNLELSDIIGQNSLHYEVKNSGNASMAATNNVQTQFDAGGLSFLQNVLNADLNRLFRYSEHSSLNVALGAEMRYENFNIRFGEPNSYINGGRIAHVDSIAPYPGQSHGTLFPNPVIPVSGAQVFPGFKDVDAVNASRNVYSLYGDLELTSGRLLLDGALRFEDYAEQGFSYSNLGGKLSARYEMTPAFTIRGSVSNGFRAPSLHQRYFQNTSTQFVNGQPSNSLTANNQNPIVREAFGIGELKPETSTNFSLGLAGKIGTGLTYTVDGYFISIHDRIVLSTAFNRSNPLVNAILTAGGVDPSTSALQFWTNAVNTETKGIDVVVTDRVRLGKGNLSLSLAANFNKNTVVGSTHTNSVIDNPKNNPSLSDPTANPANDLSLTLFDRQQRNRIETGQPASKFSLMAAYTIGKWDFLARAVRWGQVQFLNNVDPNLKNKNTGAYFNDIALGTDQIFGAKLTTDLVVTFRLNPSVALSAGGNNIFDVYPDKVFVDPRNDLASVYANPIQGANKAPGGYNSGRDASNRGRLLYYPNQFGYNGRFLFARVSVNLGMMNKK